MLKPGRPLSEIRRGNLFADIPSAGRTHSIPANVREPDRYDNTINIDETVHTRTRADSCSIHKVVPRCRKSIQTSAPHSQNRISEKRSQVVEFEVWNFKRNVECWILKTKLALSRSHDREN